MVKRNSKGQFVKGMTPWNKKKHIEKQCPVCDQIFYVKPSLDRIIYCSQSCAGKSRPSCFKGKKHTNFSKQKMRAAKLGIVGPAHPLWKGGRDSRHDEMRRDPYKKWRQAVFERDNYTCQECGQMGCVLNAHHIQSWKDFPELRYDIDNGVTVCVSCHYKIHTKR